MPASGSPGQHFDFLPKSEMGSMVETLQKDGYTVLGPVIADGVVALRALGSAADLARGVRDEQSPGHYRLLEGDPELYFQFAVGPDSPKRHLLPPSQLLFGLHEEGSSYVVDQGPPEPPKLAFLGIRPCEIAAIEIQDRIFGANDPRTFRCECNPYYTQVRQNALLIAVNCTKPCANCFCTCMDTGPVVKGGFDVAMTELRGGFVVQTGSPRGADLVRKLGVREPSSAELELAELRLAQAKASVGRKLETEGLVEALAASIEHPRWAEVAKRCLGCGNCTMVCPTCSCGSIRDSSDLSGKQATRSREWESCYTHQFSYTVGGTHRASIRARYRHWLRHKLCTWWEQYGVSGCVGCGRCITWCPAGIDLTEEAAAICRDWPTPVEALAARGKGVLR